MSHFLSLGAWTPRTSDSNVPCVCVFVSVSVCVFCTFPALRHCVKAPDSYWIFDDGSPRSGVSDGLPPSLVVARGNPNEAGGRPMLEDDVDDADPNVFVVDCILEARFQRRKKRWEYLLPPRCS